MFTLIVGLLLLVAASCCAFAQPVDDALLHTTYYAAVSKITFQSEPDAILALQDIRRGRRTFIEIAQSVNGAQSAASTSDQKLLYSGDLGLVTFADLEPEIARVAFDVRQPITHSAKEIMGPVCTRLGCTIFIVVRRYRKSFFSSAWFELEQYAKASGVEYFRLLDDLHTTEAEQAIAHSAWPQEDVAIQKQKIALVKQDLDRIRRPDPSTSPTPPSLKSDPLAHNERMRILEEIFAHVPDSVKAQHPEVYAMSIDQLVQNGYLRVEGLSPEAMEAVSAVQPAGARVDRPIDPQSSTTTQQQPDNIDEL